MNKPAPHIEPYWTEAQKDVLVIVATDIPPTILTKPKAVRK